MSFREDDASTLGYENVIARAKRARDQTLEGLRRAGKGWKEDGDYPLEVQQLLEKGISFEAMECSYCPTPEEIVLRASQIQEKWTEETKRKRAGALASVDAEVAVSYETTEVKRQRRGVRNN